MYNLCPDYLGNSLFLLFNISISADTSFDLKHLNTGCRMKTAMIERQGSFHLFLFYWSEEQKAVKRNTPTQVL